VTSEKIYYLGDTVDDAKAAKDGGVIGIGVLPPQDKSDALRAKLLEAGAYAVISDTNELLEFLEQELTLA
jgi:phosphoglycolate phosphatase-like HAD superfamily hydrolase